MGKPFIIPQTLFKENWKDYCLDQIKKKTVKEKDGCWTWTGVVSPDMKTRMRLKSVISLSAQRLSYMCFKGAIEEGFYILRTCTNRLCINPEHLIMVPAGMKYEDLVLYDQVYDEDMNLIKICL